LLIAEIVLLTDMAKQTILFTSNVALTGSYVWMYFLFIAFV